MSISLSFKGAPRRLLLLPRRPRLTLKEALAALQADHGYRIWEDDVQAWSLEFCPGGFLAVTETDAGIEGEAITSGAGPGFHKAVSDFLGALARQLAIRLQVEDDTGYPEHRDFARLQAEHRRWLAKVAGIVSHPQFDPCVVAWNAGWKPAELRGICTPVGRFSKAQIRAGLERGDDLTKFSRRFYVWYNDSRDALYHRGAALRLIWTEVRWGQPRNRQEQAALEQAAGHLARARELDPDLPLPLGAWRQVLTLTGRSEAAATGPDMAAEPGAELAGYRREELYLTFPGGWQARLPGDFTLGDRPCDEERAFFLIERDPDAGAVQLHPTGTPVVYGTTHCGSWWQEADQWRLCGEVRHSESCSALVVITLRDPRWLDWAIAAFRSVRPPRA